MKRYILLALMLIMAACTQPVVTNTPLAEISPAVDTATAIPVDTRVPTITIETATPVYPIILTVIPLASGSINVREAICRAVYTTYQLWPYALEVAFNEQAYQECLNGVQ